MPDDIPIACGTPRRATIACSNASTAGPKMKRWLSQTASMARCTSGRMSANCAVRSRSGTRIEAWLPSFAEARPDDEGWAGRWVELLARSAELSPEDDRAIIRDNNAHGYPTESLLYCTAEVSADAASVRSHVLAEPGHWG